MYLIAVDGVDNSGKSHVVRRITEEFKGRVHSVAFPTKHFRKKEIWQRISNPNTTVHDRIEFINEVMEDMEIELEGLYENEIVIIDRFIFSTMAYQTKKEEFALLNNITTAFGFMVDRLDVKSLEFVNLMDMIIPVADIKHEEDDTKAFFDKQYQSVHQRFAEVTEVVDTATLEFTLGGRMNNLNLAGVEGDVKAKGDYYYGKVRELFLATERLRDDDVIEKSLSDK